MSRGRLRITLIVNVSYIRSKLVDTVRSKSRQAGSAIKIERDPRAYGQIKVI